jgi:hypothetical protein
MAGFSPQPEGTGRIFPIVRCGGSLVAKMFQHLPLLAARAKSLFTIF